VSYRRGAGEGLARRDGDDAAAADNSTSRAVRLCAPTTITQRWAPRHARQAEGVKQHQQTFKLDTRCRSDGRMQTSGSSCGVVVRTLPLFCRGLRRRKGSTTPMADGQSYAPAHAPAEVSLIDLQLPSSSSLHRYGCIVLVRGVIATLSSKIRREHRGDGPFPRCTGMQVSPHSNSASLSGEHCTRSGPVACPSLPRDWLSLLGMRLTLHKLARTMLLARWCARACPRARLLTSTTPAQHGRVRTGSQRTSRARSATRRQGRSRTCSSTWVLAT